MCVQKVSVVETCKSKKWLTYERGGNKAEKLTFFFNVGLERTGWDFSNGTAFWWGKMLEDLSQICLLVDLSEI